MNVYILVTGFLYIAYGVLIVKSLGHKYEDLQELLLMILSVLVFLSILVNYGILVNAAFF